MIKDWEKEFETFFIWSKPMEKPTAFTITDKIKLKSFISNLLAQKDKEHIEMTKELVAKKNKDCQRYLETQKNIPMGVSQWRNHGKKWYYWEFWAEQERTQILEEIEKWANENKFPLEVCAKIETLLKALKDK